LVDNTSRDVRFAFANEVARACDALGINANDVIRYGKLGYARTDVARPGLVGGPCLAKDPHILVASVAQAGINLEISAASRLVNERQPAETVSSILSKLRQRGPGPFKVVVAGLAFKGEPETDDLRGAMSLHVIDQLNASGACCELRAFDPIVGEAQLAELATPAALYDDLYEACEGMDALIIANNHPTFATLDVGRILDSMRAGGFIYDYWNKLSHLPPDFLNDRYFTVGNLAGKF
jgi:UDP-N-acetyl-D-mannosaminuronic acid dehydrogenase